MNLACATKNWAESMKRAACKAKILIVDLAMRLGYFAGRPLRFICPSRFAHTIASDIAKESQ
jgi:hypothetical protein